MYGSAVDNSVWMRCQRGVIERLERERKSERVALSLSAVAMLAVTAAAWGLA
jgi:uncharacterized protein (UPF0303 family)